MGIQNVRRIILASASPRRKEILSKLGVPFEIQVSTCDENIGVEDPSDMVEQLSKLKADDVAKRNPDALVIGADTVVSYGNSILGKPKDREDAIGMIKMISGHEHHVYTGVTIVIPGEDTVSFVESTCVKVAEMSDVEIERYVDSGEPMDKAGAYAIQGLFAPYITGIEGDYYNVVGLPIASVYSILKRYIF